MCFSHFFFFFQAEDGIRDVAVTGVQTCALPICSNVSGANGADPVNIFGSPAWTSSRSIAYVVWDEDSGTFWNQVAAVAVGPWGNGPGGRDGAHFTHYSLLRTWEVSWDLPPLGPGDRAAAPMLSGFNLRPDAAAAGRAARP